MLYLLIVKIFIKNEMFYVKNRELRHYLTIKNN